ncbi:hypothetical protein [Georhizobium sp. MAB10]|uniref:hypothetical protein n=1 Tax=Georhizobium sp. MAB10 TaxID=3028319 RepID=UPI003856027D
MVNRDDEGKPNHPYSIRFDRLLRRRLDAYAQSINQSLAETIRAILASAMDDHGVTVEDDDTDRSNIQPPEAGIPGPEARRPVPNEDDKPTDSTERSASAALQSPVPDAILPRLPATVAPSLPDRILLARVGFYIPNKILHIDRRLNVDPDTIARPLIDQINRTLRDRYQGDLSIKGGTAHLGSLRVVDGQLVISGGSLAALLVFYGVIADYSSVRTSIIQLVSDVEYVIEKSLQQFEGEVQLRPENIDSLAEQMLPHIIVEKGSRVLGKHQD